MNQQTQSPLLRLPAELQLTIFEYAVQEEEPLLLNCGCDSSYYGDRKQWEADKTAWAEGQLRPPKEPALTRTCALIRDITLPMWYKMSVFRAHYCYAADKVSAIAWLDRLGPAKRSMLRDVAFWDLNPGFDYSVPRDLMQLKRSKLCREMGGVVETEEMEDRCFHRVTFRQGVEDEFEGLEGLFV